MIVRVETFLVDKARIQYPVAVGLGWVVGGRITMTFGSFFFLADQPLVFCATAALFFALGFGTCLLSARSRSSIFASQ